MFEPEELMARIVDLEEQLIACLEGEIAKRDEELAACRVAVENCEVFRARIAELEFELEVAKTDELSAAVWAATETIKHDLWDAQAELAALKAQEPAGWTVSGPDGRLYLSDYATEDQDEADLWPSTLIEGFTVVRVYADPAAPAADAGVNDHD